MPEPLRVYLEFEASEDPIAGTVTSGRERRAFRGWLGLIAGLENAIGGWQQGSAGFTGAVKPALEPLVDRKTRTSTRPR